MDLDNIKKDWQEASLKSNINEEKITQMIDNKGQSAFNKLLKFERLGMIVLPILLFAAPIYKYTPVIILFVSFCLIAICWQAYKYRFLKKVDILRMNIMEISRFYITYRKYVIGETIVCFAWLFTILPLLFYMTYENEVKSVEQDGVFFIIFSIIVFLLGLALSILGCWFFYWRHVRTLGRSIKELEELEKENN